MEIIIDKVRSILGDYPIVVATTSKIKDEVIVETARSRGVDVYRGSEEDVLDRFIGAANEQEITKIIRICADNPFLDKHALQQLTNEYYDNPVDYMSYLLANDLPSIRSNLGLFAEIASIEALMKVAELTDEKRYHEHVTNYIYSNPAAFKLAWLDVPEDLFNRSDIRLTLDTLSDFDLQKKIYSELSEKHSSFGINEIILHLDSHPEYIQAMKEQIAQNPK